MKTQYWFHVYDPDGDLQASCRYATLAAAVVSALGEGATIRDKDHTFVVWVEGREIIPASRSPITVAEIIAKRCASRRTLQDIPDHGRYDPVRPGGTQHGGGRRPITEKPRNAMRSPYYMLTDADVGQFHINAFGGRVWPVSDFMGIVLAKDVGKRVYLRGRDHDILQVENDAQRATRKNAEPGSQ